MNMGSGMLILAGESLPIQNLNITFSSDHSNKIDLGAGNLSIGAMSVGNTTGQWQVWDGTRWVDSIWINPYDTQTVPDTNPYQPVAIEPLPWTTDPVPAVMPSFPPPLTPEQMRELVAEAFRKLKEMPPEERRQLEEANRKVNPSKAGDEEPKRKKPRRMIQT